MLGSNAAKIIITAVDETKGAFESIDKSLSQTTKNLLSFAAAYKAAGEIKEVIAVQAQFEQSISDLSAITGATGDQLKYLSGQAREMGASTIYSATQAADAFKLVASAKPDLLENSKALAEVTHQSLILAEAAGSTLPDAANTLGSSLNQFQASGDQAGRFINVLAAGAKYGASEIQDTAQALKMAGTVAGSVGLSFEQTNAAIQILSQVALKGAEAGTGLRGVLLHLEQQADGRFKPSVVGLSQAFHNLRAANLSTAQQVKLFGLENIAAAQALTQHSDNIQTMTDKLTGTNVAYDQAAIRTNNLQGDLKALTSAYQEQQIELGEKLNPAMRGLAEGFTLVLTGEKQSNDEAKESIRQSRELAITVAQLADMAGNAANGIVYSFKFVGSAIGAGAAQMVTVIEGVETAIEGISTAMVAALHGNLKAAGDIFAKTKADFGKTMDETARIGTAWSDDMKANLDKIADSGVVHRFEDNARRMVAAMRLADLAAQQELEHANAVWAKLEKQHAAGLISWKTAGLEYNRLMGGKSANSAPPVDQSGNGLNGEADKKLQSALKNERDYFAKIHEMAALSDKSAEAAEHKRYRAQVREFQDKYDLAVNNHALSLSEEEGFQQAFTDIQRAHAQQQLAIGKENALQQLSVAGTKYRSMFEINKAVRTAEAIVDGWAAVQKAYVFGSSWGGPVGGAAMAAIAVAATAANISAIRSASFGGGTGAFGAGGGGGGAPLTTPSPLAPKSNSLQGATTPVAAKPAQTVNLTIQGAKDNPDKALISYNSFVENFIPLIKQAKDNGHLLDLNVVAA